MDIVVQRAKRPSSNSSTEAKKKRKVTGVNSKLYKPFRQPLRSLNMPKALIPIFEEHDPKPGYLRIWPDDGEDVPLVASKFGDVPKGSVLAYQQPLPKIMPDPNAAHAPEFVLPVLPCPSIVLSERQQLFYESLSISREQSIEYEVLTREQSSSRDWHRLRKNRLTASNFKSVCSRRSDHESLSARFLKGKTVQTAAMKYGIQHEDDAAQFYVSQFGRKVYRVGLVVNPSLRHLGCSPDRRVYDPSEGQPWGLLEIKCSMAELLSNLKYLKFNETTGTYSLKKTHGYYFQVMGILGLTGCTWIDFFVYCRQEFHCQRIYFDNDLFNEMLEKLNLFYFNFHLPTTVKT